MIVTQEAAQGAETVRLIVIMVGVTAAFFWRALIRVAGYPPTCQQTVR